jgi:hypothetical protein
MGQTFSQTPKTPTSVDVRDMPDWKIFWAIENNDAETLTKVCQELRNTNQDIGMYFGMRSWKQVFNETEAKSIKVYLCGLMDFSPIQHACDIDWVDGMKILFDYNIGCEIQGCGLCEVNMTRFLEYLDQSKSKGDQ